MKKIYNQAINPSQYDSGKIQWEQETADSPIRKFFFLKYISQLKDSYKGKKVLDIGCGTGWLLPQISNFGAKEVEGLEPSKINFNACKKIAPNYKVYNNEFLSFKSEKKYNTIIGMMVFIHFGNLTKAFNKVNSLLDESGELIMIIPDYDYFKRKRIDYKVEFEEINPDEYSTMIHRPIGSFADVVRKSKVYEKVGRENGFKLISDTYMYPTSKLISALPKYKEFEKTIMMHLLRFKKVKSI